jgi:hypothetical protein
MYFRLANFSLPLLAGACMVVASSIEAQQPATDVGQSIIFSSPDNGGVSSNPASLATQSSSPLNFQDNFQGASPVSTFDNSPTAPPSAPDERQQLQRRLERRKDWVFMTPAEILGVTTPEKILHIQERDAAGQPKNLTPIERYNERQQAKNARTNDSYFPDHSMPSRNFLGDRNNHTNTVSFNPADNGLKNLRPTLFNNSLNAAPNNDLFANPGEGTVWSKWVDLPAPLLAPSPAQQADMDQFRQLLERGLPPATATTLAPGGTTFFQSQTPSASSFTRPLANPAGASFTPLSSGIGKPAGLESLPGVTGQAGSQSAFTPSLAPQSPPWMSQTPQPFVIPQRKF